MTGCSRSCLEQCRVCNALVQPSAILLDVNMVQVAAYTRRTEIGIMRLVGASRWYTQLPFLVEAMAATMGVGIAVGLDVRALFPRMRSTSFIKPISTLR